ncbi:MAG: FTR1 family protein [Sulfuricellaceae bacterium]|nr:FTR1 family protein [Sulfuricellaceae bacterium]
MESIILVVWRECIEAFLIIGILYSFLIREGKGRREINYLWIGVAGGIGLSALLALATLLIQSDLQETQLSAFQTLLLLAAAALMTQMVVWMRRQGPQMKRRLDGDIGSALASGRRYGVLAIAALAVAREGSETVLYIYSLGINADSSGGISVPGAVGLGIGLAALTAWGFAKGFRFLSYRNFFLVTEVVLLFSAAGLLISGVTNLIGMGLVSPLVSNLWNTSFLLDSGSHTGSIVASLTGYRSQPSLTQVLVYLGYWTITLIVLKRVSRNIAPSSRRRAA